MNYTKQMIDSIKTGNTILFVGAGFSIDSNNMYDESLPMAKTLANKIGEKGGFDAQDDLLYAADRFVHEKGKEPLIDLLRKLYTVKKVGESAVKILSVPYRRIYTTNYDNVIEEGRIKNSNPIASLDTDANPKEFYKKRNHNCVHINGSILNITLDNFDKSFKITESSYLSNDSFVNSKWWFPFKQDLDACSAIIFVGYSLNYDIDIKKILFENSDFKEKTFFITKDISEKDNYILSKYGHVVNIGTEGFAKEFENINIENNEECLLKVFVEKDYLNNLPEGDINITDDDIKNLLIRGVVNEGYISKALNGEDIYTIYREKIDFVLAKLEEKNLISITSEFGNGKTIFLMQLARKLAIKGYNVFWLDDYQMDYHDDLDLISKNPKAVLIIDRYTDVPDLVKKIVLENRTNIKTILSDRTSNHTRISRILLDTGFDPFEVNIDLLESNEINDFIELIEYIGYWGEEASNKLSIERKFHESYNKQISFLLMDLFESEHIKNIIKSNVDNFMQPEESKITLFSILLLSLLGAETERSYISEISNSDLIYKSNFLMRRDLNELFKIEYGQIISRSSILSGFIIKNFFNSSYIIEQLKNILIILEKNKKNNEVFANLQRNLFRFHFVEQFFPKYNKAENIRKYYETIKSPEALRWLTREPHYWLQYAMSDMANKNYIEAQKKLDTAYSYAQSRDYYDASAIENQQARLYLLQALGKSIRGDEAFEFFKKADIILSFSTFDKYDAKQISLYKNVYIEKYKNFPKKAKSDFISICENKYKIMIENKKAYRDLYIGSPEYSKCEKALEYILNEENINIVQ